MTNSYENPYLAALQWHIDCGVDEPISNTPENRTLRAAPKPKLEEAPPQPPAAAIPVLEGGAALKKRAVACAASANTPEELAQAIKDFDGLSIRKTATQMVFADGAAKAQVMLIGEAPGADEDRLGRPFVGASGQLLDRILASIGLGRTETDPDKAVYITNVLNWRPPGNRTPTVQEIDLSLPFVERHIALIRPKIILLCGGVAAKGVLGREEPISKLRGQWYRYRPIHPSLFDDLGGPPDIEIMATFHPAYLLRTPLKKKDVWADMLMLKSALGKI